MSYAAQVSSTSASICRTLAYPYRLLAHDISPYLAAARTTADSLQALGRVSKILPPYLRKELFVQSVQRTQKRKHILQQLLRDVIVDNAQHKLDIHGVELAQVLFGEGFEAVVRPEMRVWEPECGGWELLVGYVDYFDGAVGEGGGDFTCP